MRYGRYGTFEQEHWTRSAIECYRIGCNCSKCYLNEIMKGRCRMKAAVIELVRKFGAPKKGLDN